MFWSWSCLDFCLKLGCFFSVMTINCTVCSRPFSVVVADFGCGDCKIARSVKNKVHSFDLAAACELVTVCDMASVSVLFFLRDDSVMYINVIGNITHVLCDRSHSLIPLWTSSSSAFLSWEPTWQIFWPRPVES